MNGKESDKMFGQMKKKNHWRTKAAGLLLGAVLAVSGIVSPLAGGLQVQAKAAYDTKYSQSISMESLLLPALSNRFTDANGVYTQLKQALRYQKIYQGNILNLINQGANIPADALKKLYEEGLISGFLYHFGSGQAFTCEDYKDVFDPVWYWASNPDLQAAYGTYDANTMLVDFLTTGMSLGRSSSSTFNLTYFKSNYSWLQKYLGDDNANYYLFYILFGKDMGMTADKKISR